MFEIYIKIHTTTTTYPVLKYISPTKLTLKKYELFRDYNDEITIQGLNNRKIIYMNTTLSNV